MYTQPATTLVPTTKIPGGPRAGVAPRWRRQPAEVLADLRVAQLDAAIAVAALDLDDAALWRQADATVAELARAAYRLAAAVTGEPAGATARNLPPVTRVRELAQAQWRLFRALDRHPAPPGELIEEASHQVRRLRRALP
jgi:hypothetical protein